MALAACGGSKDGAKAASDVAAAPESDPVALLPGGAISMATVNARAFFESKSVGPQVAQLVERYFPYGEEVGFRPSRDLDRMYLAAYAMQGADGAGVLLGRFDEAKIKAVVESRKPVGGAPIMSTSYAGRTIYTTQNVSLTLLSSKIAVVGTDAGIRRVLDRMQGGQVKRDAPPWMLATLETPSAAAAWATDLANPAAASAANMVNIPGMQGLKTVRVVADFKDPGLHLAGSLTMNDDQGATVMAEQLRNTRRFAPMLALLGLRIQNLEVTTAQKDVQFQLGVDDQSLRVLAANLPKWIGQ